MQRTRAYRTHSRLVALLGLGLTTSAHAHGGEFLAYVLPVGAGIVGAIFGILAGTQGFRRTRRNLWIIFALFVVLLLWLSSFLNHTDPRRVFLLAVVLFAAPLALAFGVVYAVVYWLKRAKKGDEKRAT